MQKIYNVYTIVLWSLWGIVMGMTAIAGGSVYTVRNESLFSIVESLSEIIHWISLVPVIPVLWVFAVVSSLKNSKNSFFLWNIGSGILTFILYICFVANHAVAILGGV